MYETLKNRLNSEFNDEFAIGGYGYKSVHVILLFWDNDDCPGFRREAGEIRDLFTKDFHFLVQEFAIPE